MSDLVWACKEFLMRIARCLIELGRGLRCFLGELLDI